MNVDLLDEAQRLVGHSKATSIEIAQTLALIDIGRSLRDIHIEMHDWNTYGLNVKKRVD